MLIPILLLLVVAGLVVAGGVVYAYWWRIQRPVPALAGQFEVAGLEAPVEVIRERHGIPHIYAENDADMYRALGYVHAQDRLWQMEQKRRTAHGRLAELFGEPALEADRFSRIIGIGRAAQHETENLHKEERDALDAYAAGVNAYMRRHDGRLAAEFNLLRHQPEPWSALDSIACLKLFAWASSVNWESELLRLSAAGQAGPVAASELEPGPSVGTIIFGGGPADAAPNSQSIAARLMLEGYEQIRPWLEQSGSTGGSNSWVVGPELSATGRAVLAADTHMGVQIPVQWYEARHSSPGTDASGATMPGIPGIWCGHNENIAWGMTNALCDVQDLYVERENPDEPGQFMLDGQWYDAEVIEERIRVRGRDSDHVERVFVTRHGPVISSLVRDKLSLAVSESAISLCWTGHEAGHTLSSLISLNRAGGWETFRSALAEWHSPPLVFTFADVEGEIGGCLAGRIPERTDGNGVLPAPGCLGSSGWSGYLRPQDLPYSHNPATGYIVSANNKPSGPDDIRGEYDPGWRAARIEEMLLEKDRHTLRDMAEMQMDTGSGFARQLAPWFGQLEPEDSYEKVACGLLRKWDYHMAADSNAATVFQYASRALLRLVFGDKLGPVWDRFGGASMAPIFPERGFDLRMMAALSEIVVNHELSTWYVDAATGQARGRQEVLSLALTEAVRRLRTDLGDNARRWEWGRLHQVRYTHPLGGARVLRPFFNRGPYPVGGDSTTPLQTGELPRLPPSLVQIMPSYRQVIDVGNWEQTQSVIATGQSGHPLSPHYADQIELWREGAFHAMPWSAEAVGDAAVYRMTLVPAGEAA